MTTEERSLVQVRGYERKRQLAPKTWLVTTVKPYERRKPRPAPRPTAQPAAAAA